MKRSLLELELLNARGSMIDNRQLEKERLGQKGENLIKQLLSDSETIADSLFEIEGHFVQFDFLVICRNKIIILEVKNHQNDIEIIKGNWYFMSGRLCSNPVQQLERAKSLLEKWLKYRNIFIPIEGYVVWVNADSHIYGLEKSDCVIRTGQLRKILSQLDANYQNPFIVHLLENGRQLNSPFERQMDSDTPPLPGLHCPCCFQLTLTGSRKILKCSSCRHTTPIDKVIFYQLVCYCVLHHTIAFKISHIEASIGHYFSHRTLSTYIKSFIENGKIIQLNTCTFKLSEPLDKVLRKLEDNDT